MADIIQLAARSAWSKWEKNLRDLVMARGGTDFMAVWIINDLKPRFDACFGAAGLDIQVPLAAADSFVAIGRYLVEMTSAYLGEMTKLEIELFAAKFGSAGPDPR